MSAFEIGYEDEALRVATAGNLFVSVWSGALTMARLDALLECERQVRKRHPEGFAIASIVASTPIEMLKSDESVRKKAGAIGVEMAPVTLALADVILGDGFWAATVRGIIVSVNLVNRLPYPRKTFDTLAPASAWLQGYLANKPARLWTASELDLVLRRASEGRTR